MKPVGNVVSGIRATGRLHLGNYLGVLQRFAEMSHDPSLNSFFFIADLHTLTTLEESHLIKEHSRNIVLDYLAAGVDYDRAAIYFQSQVPSVTELTWYLNCLTPVTQLDNLPDYKAKSKQQPENINSGLHTYPVLMAADILGVRASLVPVGKDQLPHLELARDLARKFNNRYGNYFPIPDAMRDKAITVPGLSAKGKKGFPKMGKSDDNTINLSDTDEQIWERLRVAPTDPRRVRRTDPGDPKDCAIYQLHRLVSPQKDVRAVAKGCRSAGIGCVDCKKVLAGSISDTLKEFRERRAELAAIPGLLDRILEEGRERAEEMFSETIAHVRVAMGID